MVLLTRGRVDYRESTDALMAAGVTVAEIAEALGVQHATARAYRMDPKAAGYRRPPAGWEDGLAALAHDRGQELQELAERIRGQGE